MMLTQESAALDARGLTKSFPGVRALHNVNFSCRPGRVHALLGENGAGKSTLVRILTGNEQYDQGELSVAGSPVQFDNPRQARAKGVSAVYQELTVLPAMSVLDNVMLSHEVHRRGWLDHKKQRASARTALARVGLGEIDLNALAGDFSLANQQLIEIARALVRASSVIILDEPSAVLSGEKLDALHTVVTNLAKSGAAVVYITHLLAEVEALADDVTVLRDGETVSTGPASEYTVERIVREMVGRTVESTFPEHAEPTDDIVLSLDGLVPRASSHTPRPLDLEVRAGEIIGIAGLLGSGRSRLLRTIAGVHPVASGRITVGGTPIGGSVRRAIRAGVAFVPEERKTEGLVLDLSVAANTSLTVLGRISRLGWLSRSKELAIFAVERGRLGIRAAAPAQLTRELSGGNQQKIVFAKWLERNPLLLLLDEPTRGVDVGAKAEIYRIISELAKSGIAVVLASSELIEVLGLAHRVLVCREGSIVGEVPGSLGNEEEVMHLAMGSERS